MFSILVTTTLTQFNPDHEAPNKVLNLAVTTVVVGSYPDQPNAKVVAEWLAEESFDKRSGVSKKCECKVFRAS